MGANLPGLAQNPVASKPIPLATLKRQLVDHGGKSHLTVSQVIPDDSHAVVVTVKLQPWGTDFGAFSAFCVGPPFHFNVA